MTIIVIAIAHECLAKTVTIVKHRGDTIETETIEVILLEPELTIGKQEVQHLVLSVVEAQAVPSRMLTTVALIEILAWVTGKVTKTFHLVLHSMTVHDIHDNGNTCFVGSIDEFLQFLGSTEA